MIYKLSRIIYPSVQNLRLFDTQRFINYYFFLAGTHYGSGIASTGI